MRRVICDMFMIITTITTSIPDQEDAGDGRDTGLSAVGPSATPLATPSATPAAEPAQVGDDVAQRWIIYQELIIVHCQRDPAADQTVIDCNSESFTTNFSNDSSQEA